MTAECKTVEMLDLRGPETVEILANYDSTGRTILWVNIDGLCRLRVQFMKQLTIHGEAVTDHLGG
jgi:hypothetical protein